ncbi:MAG: DUF4331 domain-containing protein [Thermoleophilia bacterium]|nr:DUF4331 domain-containing protein [Thermoleophilia bacterium]
MKRGILVLLGLVVAVVAAAFAAALVGNGPSSATASSHREAPLIADDPTADNTDLYAFVSPDADTTVTLIANYIPFEDPAGGPNYNKFDPNVVYAFHVYNNGDGKEDVSYEFRFKTTVSNPNTFLYNTGPIGSDGASPNLSVKQTYSVTRVEGHKKKVIANNVIVPPANIGPRSNPTYDAYAGVTNLGGHRKVFAGPRDDPFFVDLGSIFDLGGLRPFNSAYTEAIPHPLADAQGTDGLRFYNVHTIALQVPKTDLVAAPKTNGIIGVYASASRPKVKILQKNGTFDANGPLVQVSRLGNPLINEVIIPLGDKDRWNASDPADDRQFKKYYEKPELAGLVNFLYPPLVDTPTENRGDLVAVLLTGVKLADGSNFTYTGEAPADLLRLNTAVAPTAHPEALGVLAGDLQGFPNGRRLADDVTDIELRAIACGYGSFLANPLVVGLCNFTPNNMIGDGLQNPSAIQEPDANENAFLPAFPYVAKPNNGYDHTGHR